MERKMVTECIKGIIVPIITPIDKEEKIDEEVLRRHVEYLIRSGMHGILAFGSNGEFYQLEEDEMERGLKIMLDQSAGRVPVYFGIGAINTRKCVRLARMAAHCHVAGISILQPMFLKPDEEELYDHFKTIAESVSDTPILIYNNPGRTGYGLTVELVTRLAHEVDNIIGLKDTSGDITFTEECVRRNRDIDFRVFGGKDTLLYASLCVGAVGGVCTTGNFMPEITGEIYNRFTSGDLTGSLEAQFRLNPVRLAMDAVPFPNAAKDMMRIRNMDAGDPYRPGKRTADGQAKQKMIRAMKDAGLI